MDQKLIEVMNNLVNWWNMSKNHPEKAEILKAELIKEIGHRDVTLLDILVPSKISEEDAIIYKDKTRGEIVDLLVELDLDVFSASSADENEVLFRYGIEGRQYLSDEALIEDYKSIVE